MKIAIDIRPLFDGNAFRGIGTYVRRLVQELITLDGPEQYLLIHEPVSGFHEPFPVSEKVQYRSLPRFKPRILSSKEKWLWERRHLSRLLRQENPDLFHATALVGPLAPDIRRVATCFDFIPLKYPEKKGPSFSGWRANMRYRVQLRSLRQADFLLTISRHTRKDAVEYLGVNVERTAVIPLAAGEDFRVRPDEQGFKALRERFAFSHPVLLYVGGVDRRKNLPAFLRAVAGLIRESSLPCHPVIAGTPLPLLDDLKAQADELGLTPYVRFTGTLPMNELITLYNHADLFCFPSLEEGFGLPVLEAMACGLPVVAYRSAAVEEVAGASALLVDSMENDFAGAVLRLLSDEACRKEYRARGLARAQAFSWRKTAEATRAVYVSLIQPSKNER